MTALETCCGDLKESIMGKDKTGKSLEKAVAKIQQMMDPNSTVTHNEYLNTKLGHRRQFDVVIRGKLGGRDILGVIECKDWSDKVGTPEVEAFVTKSRYVNANIVLMVSPKGFTSPGLALAKHEGVGTLSLLPDDPEDAGFALGVTWFAKAWRWSQLEVSIHFPPEHPPCGPFKAENVLLNGKPVVDWFWKQLYTTYAFVGTETDLPLQVVFKETQQLQIEGELYPVTSIVVKAKRVCDKKKRFVRVTGEAMFDWETSKLSIPAEGKVTFTLPHGFDDWQEFDGDIEAELAVPKGFLVLCFQMHQVDEIAAGKDVIDLAALSAG